MKHKQEFNSKLTVQQRDIAYCYYYWGLLKTNLTVDNAHSTPYKHYGTLINAAYSIIIQAANYSSTAKKKPVRNRNTYCRATAVVGKMDERNTV